MDREGFRNRLKQYKLAREENPGLKYWEWKEVPKYATGTNNVYDESNTSGIKTVFTTDGNAWRKRPTQEMLDAFYSGDVKRQAQLAEQAGQQVTYTSPEYTLDELVVTAKDLKKEQQRKQEYNNVLDLVIAAAGFVPGLGEVADAVDVSNQLRQGNYGEALTSTAAFLLPGVSANLLRKGVKGIKSMLYNTGRFFQPTTYDKLLELYKNTPILNQKGTFEDYLNYTKTIFPESAISDIHYHGGAKGITKFKDTGEEITTVNPGAKNGIYFSPHKKYSENVRKDRARLLNADGTYRPILKSIGLNLMRNKLNKKVLDETELYTVLLNSKKPLYTTGTWTWAIDDKLGKKIKTDGYDAIVNAGTNQRISKMPETIVFDPNNIHILGNELDALNFLKYLDNHNRPQNGYDLRYNPITQTYEKVLELTNQTPYYSAMSPEQHFRSTLIDGTNRHKDIWGYKQFSHAVDQGYRKNDTPIIKEFTWPNDAKVAPTIDAKGNIWFNIGELSKLTNEIVEDNVAKGFDVTKINNVDELGYPSDIAIVHPFVPIDEKVYGVSKKFKYAEGGEVGEDDFMKQFGKQVSYKPEETSWWSDVKNWWNDLTGMKNYAYGNCATTPSGKHTKECAHYSNAVLRNQGYKNIVGDAWTRAANSGMKKITSGYDGLTKPSEWDESDAHDYLQSAAENFANKVDTTALNPYDVVGLYYPDSPNTKKAFEQGRWGETQTHTGHITVGKDGTHYIVHNVGGHLKMNKLADMLTGDYDYLPVSAYRPKK